jgi:hypothetical protein
MKVGGEVVCVVACVPKFEVAKKSGVVPRSMRAFIRVDAFADVSWPSVRFLRMI